jgi:DNA-binding transcriptional LysR family regulator
MLHPTLPLNALRAFEAAARHQNFTRAALELCVSQAALSHQIRGLEDRLGIRLFHRLPRGVALTDEGAALYPVLNESFERISASIARYTGGPAREVLTLGVVGTFATGWLLPRLAAFEAAHRTSSCACRPTTTASTWPAKGWTWRSASVMATGRARPARRSSMRRSHRCAHRHWRGG